MNQVVNQTPYLRTTREFPEEVYKLSVEVNKAYLDTAQAVNNRTIGIYPTSKPAVTGNSFYLLANSRQQTFRRVYQFFAAGTIAHGITTSQIWGFSSITGTFTDGTIWYPLPYVNATAANNQISLTVDATNIIITAGAGIPPTITKGIVILEWLSLP